MSRLWTSMAWSHKWVSQLECMETQCLQPNALNHSSRSNLAVIYFSLLMLNLIRSLWGWTERAKRRCSMNQHGLNSISKLTVHKRITLSRSILKLKAITVRLKCERSSLILRTRYKLAKKCSLLLRVQWRSKNKRKKSIGLMPSLAVQGPLRSKIKECKIKILLLVKGSLLNPCLKVTKSRMVWVLITRKKRMAFQR